MLLRHLEQQSAEFAPLAPLGQYTGAIVLGGATESGYLAQGHRQPLLNSSAERMTAVWPMLRTNAQLQFIFTGGEGELTGSGPSEAERVRQFFESQGIGSDHMRYESRSRTTYENAILTAQLPGVDIHAPWLLVTSAWHMPRSLATFRKAGWNVTPYPVDFRTTDATPWTQYDLNDSLSHWKLALHEWLGLVAYRLSGRL
jgi:uncharacterized SAM-binding protein YcdF (DUF218 family)